MSAAEITVDDLIETLEAAGVLAAFCRLPQEEQARFSRWIGTARDDASHWRRIHAFVEAMKSSPLQPNRSLSESYERAAHG